MKSLPAPKLAAVFLLASVLFPHAACAEPADPLEDWVTFGLTFEGTLKPVRAAGEAGPRVVFMTRADRKERFRVKEEALDRKHFVPGLRGKGLTNADATTSFEEIQYPAAGNLKAGSGTVLFWLKLTQLADRGGGKLFSTVGGSLYFTLEPVAGRDQLGVLVVAQDQGEDPPVRLAEVRGTISRKKGQWAQLGIRWNKKSVALLINGEEAAIETLKRPFKPQQFSDYFVLSLFAFVKQSDVAVLDEFTIYNRPLTSAELKGEFERLSSPCCK